MPTNNSLFIFRSDALVRLKICLKKKMDILKSFILIFLQSVFSLQKEGLLQRIMIGFGSCHVNLIEFSENEASAGTVLITTTRLLVDTSAQPRVVFRTNPWMRTVFSTLNAQFAYQRRTCQAFFFINAPTPAAYSESFASILKNHSPKMYMHKKTTYYIWLRHGEDKPINPKDRSTFENSHFLNTEYFILLKYNNDDLLVFLNQNNHCETQVSTSVPLHEIMNFRDLADDIYATLLRVACPSKWYIATNHKMIDTGLYGEKPAPPALDPLDRDLVSFGISSIIFDVTKILNEPYNGTYPIQHARDERYRVSSFTCNPAYYPSNHLPAPKDSIGRNLYLTADIELNFVTCYEESPRITMSEYVQGFSLGFWMVAVAFTGVAGLSIQFTFSYLKYPFNIFWWIIMILFEQPLNISIKYAKMLRIKLLLASLVLSGLVLSNTYRGTRTTQLTAPIAGFKLRFLEEAVDLGLQVLLQVDNASYQIFPKLVEYWRSVESSYPDLSTKEYIKKQMYIVGRNDEVFRLLEQYPGNQSLGRLMAGLLDNVIVTDRQDYSPETELTKCNRSILLDEPLELNAILLRAFKNGHLNLYLGKRGVLAIPRFLMVDNANLERNDLIHRRFQGLINAGVFKHDTYNSQIQLWTKMHKARNEKPRASPLRVNSNFIASLYAIFTFCVGFSMIRALYELIVVKFPLHCRS